VTAAVWSGTGRFASFKSLIQRGAHIADRNGAVDFLPVDKHCGSSLHAEPSASFIEASPALILRLDAGLQLHHIKIVFLALQQSKAIERVKIGLGMFSRCSLHADWHECNPRNPNRHPRFATPDSWRLPLRA